MFSSIFCICKHEKIDFVLKYIKILLNIDLKIILLDCQNVRCLDIMSNAAKNFDILATSLNVLHNYFDSPTKLFSDLSN